MRKLILCLLLFVAQGAYAQSNYASLSGSVVNAQNSPVPGARVELAAVDTPATRRTTTNELGIFQLTGLLPGHYRLVVKAGGFAPLLETLRFEVGQQAALDLHLKVASVKSTVKVSGSSEDVMRATDASVGEVVEPESIRELPLDGRRLIDLVLTVPGAHVGFGAQTGDANPLYWRPGQRSAVSIGGNRPNANFFLLDGATNTDPTFNTQNISLSPDAVKEFQVETSSYSADMGGAGGGQINIVTKSGTDHYHGTVYEFLRNGAMDATTFDSMGKNHLVQNNFGGSLGGPLAMKKKLFFFVNYEGLRHAMAVTNIETVPTLAEIHGDFSQSGVSIYDPSTAHPNPNYNPNLPTSPSNAPIIRDQFSYNGQANVIPPTEINSAASLFLANYSPLPNLPTAPGVDSNNYLDVRNGLDIADQGTVRMDRVFANGDNAFFRYSLSGENGFTPQNLPGFGANYDNFSQQSVLSWNHIVSEDKVNTASLAVSRLSMNRTSQNDGTNNIVGQLGIQGIGFGGPGAWGAPWFAVQGYSGMGDSFAATPMHAWDTTIEARDTFSWQRGRHGLKFGGSFRRYIWPMWGFFQNRGFYQFTNGFTTQTESNDGTGSALASFLLGLPVVKQRQAGVPQMNLANWGADAFAEDNWQVTPTTTLEIGLRYEYESPLYDRQYANTNLIFENGTPSVFIGGQLGYPRGLMYSNKHDFAPRIGIAKDLPRLGLVLHAAYGIFYTPVDLNTWCNQRHNIPYVFPETQQTNNFIPPASLVAAGFNFGQPVLGQTTVSFTAFDPHAPAQYVQQWNVHVGKSLGQNTILEVGYIGSRGFHLQRAHLINNAPPGPGAIEPRRPFQTLSFVPGSVLPANVSVLPGDTTLSFPVSGINLLEDTAQSWYDAGYINLRRSYSHGLSLLANYTFAKNLTNAPDFRSPMDESAIPQNNNDLNAEKGPACDIRNRFALSSVYEIPAYRRMAWASLLTENWNLATIFQIQSGFPFTISVFGDTANSGTLLGENPIRANTTGQPVFGPGTHKAAEWFNPSAFVTPPAFTFGNVGRNSVYGPGMETLDLALERTFRITERSEFEIRGEFFNALNHTNLGTPNRYVNEPQFATITTTMTPGREVQLSARLSF
ncbi:MAG TPA: carboxypeptidase regulatory-like domain-containing protein [Candidatus Limnocylindrales bacterium]|nr:carboxypeptidase regulatory-like domain-containing protein [Candidatus Limnocylindrales bacterium]